jgi:hypothetical protein
MIRHAAAPLGSAAVQSGACGAVSLDGVIAALLAVAKSKSHTTRPGL